MPSIKVYEPVINVHLRRKYVHLYVYEENQSKHELYIFKKERLITVLILIKKAASWENC